MKHKPITKSWEARNKLYAKGDKLRAEGDKLYAEGSKLFAEGSKLYACAVIAKHGGRAIIDWATGEIEI